MSKLGSVHLTLKYKVVYYRSLPSFCPAFLTLAANVAFPSTVATSFCKEGTFRSFFLRFLFCDYEARIYSLFSCGLGEEIETLIWISIGLPCVHVCWEIDGVAGEQVAPAQVVQVVPVGGLVRVED